MLASIRSLLPKWQIPRRPIDVDYSIFLSMLTGTVVCNDTAE
jgi:hypothetical protein